MSHHQDRLQNHLKRGLGKQIFLRLRNRRYEISGKLRKFDQHLNLVLDDVQETQYRRHKDPVTKKFDQIVIRGDSIVMISF